MGNFIKNCILHDKEVKNRGEETQITHLTLKIDNKIDEYIETDIKELRKEITGVIKGKIKSGEIDRKNIKIELSNKIE